MNKRILLAGIPMELQTLFDCIPEIGSYETDIPPVFTVRTSVQDIVNERKKCIAECVHERLPYPNYSPAELENTAIYRKIAEKLPEYDGFVCHGAAVAVREHAYLFTAKSGTGKTTHTRLWRRNIEGCYVVNGDKPIVRQIDGVPNVCGTPWMGKEGYGCSKNVPLKAICLLNRGTENRIERTEFKKVYPRLLSQVYRPENGAFMVKTLRLLEQFGKSVPIFELFCNMEDEAAKVAFGGMSDDDF